MGKANRIMYLVVGAIGAGKSEFSKNLSAYSKFQKMPYISADLIKEESNIESKLGFIIANELLVNEIEKLCIKKENFICERCITNQILFDSIISIIEKYNYKIVFFFVGTSSVDINLERVKKRETLYEKSNCVSPQKIKQRFVDTYSLILKLLSVSTKGYFIDNSEDGINKMNCIATFKRNKFFIYDDSCKWLHEEIIDQIFAQNH